MKGHPLLEDVAEHHYFYASNGAVLKNIKDLHKTVTQMDESAFRHHVNEERNDFHNWIRDVHQDKQLADALLGVKNKKETIRVIGHRIRDLVRPAVTKPVPELQEKTKRSAPKKKTRKTVSRKKTSPKKAKTVRALRPLPVPQRQSLWKKARGAVRNFVFLDD